MLRWEKFGKEWHGFSAKQHVATVHSYPNGYSLLWDTGWTPVDGDLEAAKSAAEQAFKAWREQAGLTVIPDGHQIVPTKMTPAMLKVWASTAWTNEPWREAAQNEWDNLLAAAKTAQDGYQIMPKEPVPLKAR